jgi:flagella basal body P-ring formation protein FlgA
MIFTFFRNVIPALIVFSLLTGILHAADVLTGKDIKAILIERGQQDGIALSPIIAPHKVFTACATELEIIPIFGDWKTTRVSCRSPHAWKINIRSVLPQDDPEIKAIVKLKQKPVIIKKLKSALFSVAPPEQKPVVKSVLKKRMVKSFDYVVLREPATKGTILGDLKYLTTKSFKYKIRGGYTKTEQIIGRKLKASMPEGKPLLARHLATVYIVEKNDILSLTFKRHGVKISTEGMALSNGQLGETILVSNVDTGVKLKAKIKNSHQAEIITKQSN